jgi:hypothetical protein
VSFRQVLTFQSYMMPPCSGNELSSTKGNRGHESALRLRDGGTFARTVLEFVFEEGCENETEDGSGSDGFSFIASLDVRPSAFRNHY